MCGLEVTDKFFQTFKNPKAALLNLLRESGPVPGDEPKAVKKRTNAVQEEPAPVRKQKKQKIEKNVSFVEESSLVSFRLHVSNLFSID